jgi:hypothetical protein
MASERLPGAGAIGSADIVNSGVVDSPDKRITRPAQSVTSGVGAVGACGESLTGDGGRTAVAGILVVADGSGVLDVSTVSSARTGKYWEPGPEDVYCWAAMVRC